MADEILVINAGSSSIKLALFERGPELSLRLSGQVEGIGTAHLHASAKDAAGKKILEQSSSERHDHAAAMSRVMAWLTKDRPGWQPAGVGHRIVHGGSRYQKPVRLDAAVLTELRALIPLAPLHQPPSLAGISAIATAFPQTPQVGCFDTAFHAGRPFVAEAFALPREYYDAGVRRYGFHGLSYEYIARKMQALAPAVAAGRMIVAHLGNGASLCAIRAGRSVETTMAFTPLDGLPMGTRCGQIDPGVLLYLLDEKRLTSAQVSELLSKKSGLLGLSGQSSDMRDLLASETPAAKQAVDYFVYRAGWYIGALTAALGGLDGLVFTGGIGEHAAPVRERVCRNLSWLGLELDEAANRAGASRISTGPSRLSAWVVPTDEERMIALHVHELLASI